GNDLAYYTYLRDVEYQVLAHFEWNEHRIELEYDRNENKHHNIAKRSIKNGGRRDVFLGTRECQAYVEPCVFGEESGAYDNYGQLDFGVQFHGYDYPDETGLENLGARLWRAKMNNGYILFPAPSKCDPTLQRIIRPMNIKKFKKDANFMSCNDDHVVADLLKEE
ncbi:MAG: type I-C CRISPR-associated protein Cas5, partial [Desulfamplus sp.]|nr:type I-C CRISPR-associated protein Cas5 [Desulfamplus sp.]